MAWESEWVKRSYFRRRDGNTGPIGRIVNERERHGNSDGLIV